MKFVVQIAEEGWGVCDTPEHFLGRKTIYEEAFNELDDAKKAAREKVKELYDKYDLCREWKVVSKTMYHIKTNIGKDDEWNHQYEAIIYDFTDEEWEELAE